MKGDGLWYWPYLSNVWIAHKGFQWFGVIEHFWSLAIEEQFYFIWPVIVLLFSRKALLRLCIALLVIALFVRVGLWVTGHTVATYVLTIARMDALSVGAFLALAARQPNGLSRLVSWARPGATLTGTSGADVIHRSMAVQMLRNATTAAAAATSALTSTPSPTAYEEASAPPKTATSR